MATVKRTFRVVRRVDIDPGEENLMREVAEWAKGVGGFLHIEVWVPRSETRVPRFGEES